MQPDYDEFAIRKALRRAWSLDTAVQWSAENPANGQCNVTAAVIHDLFGGEILRTKLTGVWHYYNQLGGKPVDFSDSQFTDPGARFAAPDPYDDELSSREACMEGIADREYEALKTALLAALPPHEGGCACGTVRYRLTSAPMFVHCCHCTWCQRESGAAFALNALIEADRVVVLSGEPELVPTPSVNPDGQQFYRCPSCKIALWSHYPMAEVEARKMRFVRVGTLDEPQHLPPDVHIYTSTKQPWLSLDGKVPVFSEHYDRAAVWPAANYARLQELMA